MFKVLLTNLACNWMYVIPSIYDARLYSIDTWLPHKTKILIEMSE